MACAVLLALVLAVTASVATATCTEHSDTMHQQRIRKNLLCLYDRDTGPTVSPASRANVRYIFLRTRFDVEQWSSTLVLFGYVMFVWKDEWLHWDALEYPNITRVYVEEGEIWTPSIALLESPSNPLGGGQALIMNGTVYWTLHAPLRAPCIHDPSLWPYDKMVCTLTLVNLNPAVSMLEPRATQLNGAKWGKNQGWSMTRLQVRRFPKFAPLGYNDTVRFIFTMERHVGKQESTTVWPVALQPVLLAASVGLPADSPHRPLLLCTSVLVQVLLSVTLPGTIAVFGDAAPGVLVQLHDLLILTAVAVLEWAWARWMLSRPAPQHPSSSLDAVLGLADKLAVVLVLPGPSAPRTVRTVALVDRVFHALLVLVCVALMWRLVF